MASPERPPRPENQVDCKCKKCSNDLVKNSKVALLCDVCMQWHCFKCMGVSEKLFKVLSDDSTDVSMISVSCNACVLACVPINLCKANKGLSEKINEISKQLKEIKIATQSQVAACAKEIKGHRDDAKKSWADVTKMNIESSQTILAVQKEVKCNSNMGQIKLNAKDRSIIVFRRPESKADNTIDRKKDDKEFIEKFMEKGLKIRPQTIESVIRLGRFDSEKTRPIKVTFCSKLSQITVIENLSALRNAEPEFKVVSVTIDRDEDARNNITKMVKEAKLKTDASTNNKKWIVRGMYNPYLLEVNI